MAKVDVIKCSFAGGQFGASLLGRTDVAQYENACAEVENMLVRPFGSAISTPGTWLVAECKMSEAGTDSTVRLIPFVFNRSDAYAIEMGDLYFRFYTDRGQVCSGTGSTVYELVHTFEEDDLFDVEQVSLGQALFLGMTPVQRLIISVMLLMTVCILSTFCLLVTEKIALPFF